MPRPAGLPKTGGRQPGTPNRATASIREAAQEFSAQALDVLVQVATQSESDAARVAAANAILDRAHGKPKQSLDVDANVKAAIQTVERQIVRPADTNG